MAVQASVESNDANLIAEELARKHGQPSEYKTEVQNLFGAKFEGQFSIWKHGDVTLTVETLSQKLGQGSVTIMSERLQALQKDRQRGSADPANDL